MNKKLNESQAVFVDGKLQKKQIEEPTRTCDNTDCKKQAKSSDMINCIMVVGSPGHASIMPFQCPETEHWACSLDCWKVVAHACIEEHMHELLLLAHKNTPESKHHV